MSLSRLDNQSKCTIVAKYLDGENAKIQDPRPVYSANPQKSDLKYHIYPKIFCEKKVARKRTKGLQLRYTLFLPFVLLPEHTTKGTMSMLRPMARSSAFLGKGKVASLGRTAIRMMATQSPDGVNRPTALARLYFEDGTHVTGRSFGCHEAVEGEVRNNIYIHTAPCDNS